MSEQICTSCGTAMRVVSMTSEGTSSRCSCGRLSMTRLSEGKLDLGIVKEAVEEGWALDDGPDHRGDDLCRFDWSACTERPGCSASHHLSTCPEGGER